MKPCIHGYTGLCPMCDGDESLTSIEEGTELGQMLREKLLARGIRLPEAPNLVERDNGRTYAILWRVAPDLCISLAHETECALVFFDWLDYGGVRLRESVYIINCPFIERKQA